MDIRSLNEADIPDLIELWTVCGLTRPWNDPRADIQRAIEHPKADIFCGFANHRLIASVMAGYDGHRGWLYYAAIHPDFQGQNLGKALIEHAERWLENLGAPKIMLMVRHGNAAAGFYEAIGYEASEVATYGKFLT